jgi:GTPase SAR1 family protein
MSSLRDVCRDLIAYGEKTKQFWDDWRKEFASEVNDSQYSEEIARIEKFQTYDCRPTFRIGFIGEQSCGKSIFINELLQNEIVLSGAAEVTFVPTVIVFGKSEAASFCYYTQKEIKEVVKPYYDYFTQAGIERKIDEYYRSKAPHATSKATLDTLRRIQDVGSLKNMDSEILKLIYFVLLEITHDIKVAKDFVNLVYAIQTSGLFARLSSNDERFTTAIDFTTIIERSRFLKSQDNSPEFTAYDRSKIPLYEIYLVHHIYQMVRTTDNTGIAGAKQSSATVQKWNSALEFVDLPGIDAITIRVRHSSLFFLKEVDALVLLTDTQRALTLPAVEILRVLKENRHKADLQDSLFIAINKYDTINAAQGGELESFQNTLDNVQRNIRNVIGNTKVDIFVTSALMSKFFRKRQENSLAPEDTARLQAFLAMRGNPNLSGNSEVDAQIRTIFDAQNAGGIPMVRDRVEHYLQHTSLQLKRRYFAQTVQTFLQELNESFVPLYQSIVTKWQEKSNIGHTKVREKLLDNLRLSLSHLELAITGMRDYVLPLKEFGRLLGDDIQKVRLAEAGLMDLPALDRYRYVAQKLLEILSSAVRRHLVAKHQETLDQALTPVRFLLETLQQSGNSDTLSDTAAKVVFLWKLHAQLLPIRFYELVAEKPLRDMPSYLHGCHDTETFVAAVKQNFMTRLDASALGNCTRLWSYPLYCLQEIREYLLTIKKWLEKQTHFGDVWLKALYQDGAEDRLLQQRYEKVASLHLKYQALQKEWLELSPKIEQAVY